MALQAFPLPPAGAPGTNLLEIAPKAPKPPPDPITAAMVTPAYVPVISFTGGAEGNDVDVATTSTSAGAYTPRTQAQKAGLLGVAMAADVGIDYGEFAGGATRTGTVEPHEPYPVTP